MLGGCGRRALRVRHDTRHPEKDGPEPPSQRHHLNPVVPISRRRAWATPELHRACLEGCDVALALSQTLLCELTPPTEIDRFGLARDERRHSLGEVEDV